MTIHSIECIPVKMPLSLTFHGSHYQMRSRCTLVTRVRTDDGAQSTVYTGDEDEAQAEIRRIVLEELQPIVVGEDPMRVEYLWERMFALTRDILRNRGLVLQAIACVDAALNDLVGRILGQPLFRLWGGYRDTLPMLAIAGYYTQETPEAAIPVEVERVRSLGFAGMKFKIGKLSAAEDARRVRLAREAAGGDFVLAVDANQAWSREEALEFARRTRDLDVAWFEEPCHWENDHTTLRDVRMMSGLPVVAGQSETSRAGCRGLFEAGAVDQCNFDASWGAGPTEWRRVAALALCHAVRMGHHEEPQIAAHLLASIPHGTYLEGFLPERDPVFWELLASRSPLEGGRYRVPSGPGWGIELDGEVLERYRIDR